MIKKFNIWWKKRGQLVGFLGIVTYLNIYFILLGSLVKTNNFLAVGWLVSFFSCVWWYAWQSKKQGWAISKGIKNTH